MRLLILIKMKKIVVLALLVLLGASCSYAGVVIKISLSIGKKSQPATCPDFGICSFSLTNSYQDGSVNGTMDVSETRGSIIIAINEKDIQKVQPDKLVYFKDKSSLAFTEDFTMPDEIKTAVNSKKPLVIRKGQFSLTYRKGIYYIEIPYQ